MGNGLTRIGLTSLPQETLEIIFQSLPIQDLQSLASRSRELNGSVTSYFGSKKFHYREIQRSIHDRLRSIDANSDLYDVTGPVDEESLETLRGVRAQAIEWLDWSGITADEIRDELKLSLKTELDQEAELLDI